jgi:RimJ/RimL family protein N-acetyltransferase
MAQEPERIPTKERRRVTPRLILIAATAELLRAELSAPEQLGLQLGAEVPHGWPPGEYDEGAQRFFLERLSTEGPEAVGWYAWYVLLRNGEQGAGPVIASGGFLGPPGQDGEVEIGYSVHPGWQRKGYATELVHELVRHAFEDPRVHRIVAHTTRQNQPSCALLERLGFRDSGVATDPPTIRFALARSDARSPAGISHT